MNSERWGRARTQFFISYFDKAEEKPLLISEPQASARKGARLLCFLCCMACLWFGFGVTKRLH